MVLSSNIYGYSTAILDFSKNIVDVENVRISKIDTGWGTFARNRDLQVSGNKKSAAMRYIYVVIVLLILFSGIMIILKQKFDTIVIDILLVIVLSVGIIYIILMYLDVKTRSPTDYDKINPDASTIIKPAGVSSSVYGVSGDSLTNLNTVSESACIGPACCNQDMSWNEGTQQCEAFVLMGPKGAVTNYDYLKVYTAYT